MHKRDLLIGIFFVCIALFVTFPSVLSMSTKIMGDTGDTYQFLRFSSVATIFCRTNIPFGWTDFWRYPSGSTRKALWIRPFSSSQGCGGTL